MEKFKSLKAFIFDVDGVLTDGSVICYPDGEQVRSFYIKDGWAINYAIKQGYFVGAISAGYNEGVRKRLQYLGVEHIFLSVKDKLQVLNAFRESHNISMNEILYMGDDIPDIEILKEVGLSSCPKDASIDVINCCEYVSTKNGGRGAVRDVVEKVLRVQRKWFTSDQP